MVTDENTPDEVLFDMNRKKKSKKQTRRALFAETTLSTASFDNAVQDEINDTSTKDSDFTYQDLLIRAFNIIDPNWTAEKSVVPVPHVARVGTRKTSIMNFASICKAIKRQEKQLYDYFIVELGTTASIDAKHALIIKGRLSQRQIEHILSSFIRQYVLCKTCHSPNTSLGKSERLTMIKCNICHSEYSVSNIRAGFQAQIGRRSTGTA